MTDLENMKNSDLIEYAAKEYGISLHEKSKKTDILAILAALENSAPVAEDTDLEFVYDGAAPVTADETVEDYDPRNLKSVLKKYGHLSTVKQILQGPRIGIRISDAPGPMGKDDVPVTFAGYTFKIKRNAVANVPVCVAGILADAIRSEPVRDKRGSVVGWADVQAYPFEIVSAAA